MGFVGGNLEHWEARVARKQAKIRSELPVSWKLPSSIADASASPVTLFQKEQFRGNDFFSQEELDITEKYSATELIELMAAGKLSAVQVTSAYCKRAAVSQQLV